ncbi:hypothetical protein O3P69_014061 [Scylla paramamosain]|uniref:Uncharacterized protein n=1 Tax=Scylla paramamosain TaxID=85552 RepID=A0AAW0ST43_SCYPA
MEVRENIRHHLATPSTRREENGSVPFIEVLMSPHYPYHPTAAPPSTWERFWLSMLNATASPHPEQQQCAALNGGNDLFVARGMDFRKLLHPGRSSYGILSTAGIFCSRNFTFAGRSRRRVEGGSAVEGEADLAGLTRRLHDVWTVAWRSLNHLTVIYNNAQH